MEEKQLSQAESLMIIQQMISTAKQEQRDDGKGWIVWGWLLFLASLFTYVNLQYRWVNVFFFWNLFGLLSLVLLVYSTVRHFTRKTQLVRTYTKDLYQKLNVGFFITLMLIIVSMNVGVSPVKGFGLLLGLYGFWILIYGSVVNFRPSIIGAYVTWACAFATLFVPDFSQTMLLHAAAVLCGYIIPGHLANREFNKMTQKRNLARV
jgi:hypothetical protein